MNPTRWSDLREKLRTQAPAAPPAAPDVFWADFRARARMTRQEAPGPVALWRRPVLRYGAGVAAAAAAAVLAFLAPPGSAHVNRIRSLEVIASHTGVMILNDTAKGGTILWVTGLDAAPPNGG